MRWWLVIVWYLRCGLWFTLWVRLHDGLLRVCFGMLLCCTIWIVWVFGFGLQWFGVVAGCLNGWMFSLDLRFGGFVVIDGCLSAVVVYVVGLGFCWFV